VGVGVGGGSGYPSNQLCGKRAANGPKTHYKAKITAMDNWEQLHTNVIVTLLKSTKHCHNLFRVPQGHEKAIWKSRSGYL